MLKSHFHRAFPTALIALISATAAPQAHARAPIPTPKSVLGFEPTSDRTIADWTQITRYFARLDASSDRVKIQEIGKSTLGKPLIAAFISAPENIRNLEKYKRINRKLADPRTISTPTERENLLREGKVIVSISCSIHSTEIVASQMSMVLAHQLASANDPETREILGNTILLLIPSPNPDGIDIVANWYRGNLGTPFEASSPPELYHHYAGHDDNRDWFMLSLRETQHITKFFWQEWFPHIVYDVHQKGQTGSRYVIPPFFDPPNPRIAPLLLREVGLLGYKMASDVQGEGIAGVATNSTYDTWWHGGFRSAPYFHNSIGILSEAASADLMSPLQITRERLASGAGVRGLASPLQTATNYPDAWEGGGWGPRDIARLELLSSRAILQMAAKFRARYLKNFLQLGQQNLEAQTRDPQAFVIYPNQLSAQATARFLEILLAQGMEIHRVAQDTPAALDPKNRDAFTSIPAGSFVVLTRQPQKPNVLSLFETQSYPQRLRANGEAETPYDVAGWTLPLQMGIKAASVWNLRPDFAATKIADAGEARRALGLAPQLAAFAPMPNPLKSAPRIGLYRGFTASMDEGWTRLVFDQHQIRYTSVSDADFRSNKLPFDVLILPSQSENSIVAGLSERNYPARFAGGIGEVGVENLRAFVERGGKLVCFEDACDLAIKRFNLPLKNVLSGLKTSEFYNPGSLVRLQVDTTQPLARNFPAEMPAYFINSAAFEITDASKVQAVARYASSEALLSGWMLGEPRLNGQIALAQAQFGAGQIVLFAFRPQHRAQTFATFPLLFNALEK